MGNFPAGDFARLISDAGSREAARTTFPPDRTGPASSHKGGRDAC